MKQNNWKIFEDKNLADILVVVSGKNEEELFLHILQAFLNIITKAEKIMQKIEIPLKMQGKNLDELIINFINELIYLKDTKFQLFKSGSFKITFTKQGLSLYALLKGQKIGKKLPINADIKALTLHKFKVEKKANKCTVTLVFDI